jgi:hypothetical protein
MAVFCNLIDNYKQLNEKMDILYKNSKSISKMIKILMQQWNISIE